ncbi:MAG: choice-of-anchor L domain-containing protein [Bacteroidia bacterium]|nr:choice-of-anchor L domain-containing protein [Bacteroidia bacterium]
MKKIFLSATFLSLSFVSAFAQNAADFKTYKTQPTGNFDARHLLQTLVGNGVVLKSFSITKTSSDEAFGFFEDKNAILGMKKGLIMTTGSIAGLCSGNTSQAMSNNVHVLPTDRLNTHPVESRCPDLEKFLNRGQKTFDACVIELDIVPTADTLSFNYVFGSEEYDEFVGSQYNDVFGFFISGKGIEGEKNLAVVPNTKIPVSVNTINNGSNSYHTAPTNSTFYVSNVSGNISVEYDGLTKLMEIRQPVIAYETYHLKMAIADVTDNSYDSGVFLEGQSIVSYEKSYNVLYEKNNDEIEKGYKNLLDNLAALYKDNKKGKILITGHTDNEGSEELNAALSCSRATKIVEYLKNKGVDATRIVMDCKGETQPRYDNNNDKGKILNRRVELKISGAYDEYEKRKTENEVKEETSKLLSNYPNPFSVSTTIETYLLQDVKDARIMITDLNGSTLKTIYLLERGKTSTFFEGTNLVSGTYVATLICDGKSAGSIKLVVAH